MVRLPQCKTMSGRAAFLPPLRFRLTDGNIRGLPNRFESNAQVLSAIVQNDRLGRPDNYYATLPARYRAIDATALDSAAQRWLQADGLTFVVVGDRKVVEPQLAKLGLPVEVMPAAAEIKTSN